MVFYRTELKILSQLYNLPPTFFLSQLIYCIKMVQFGYNLEITSNTITEKMYNGSG